MLDIKFEENNKVICFLTCVALFIFFKLLIPLIIWRICFSEFQNLIINYYIKKKKILAENFTVIKLKENYL